MIKTVYLEPEGFVNKLKVIRTEKEETKSMEKVRTGIFGSHLIEVTTTKDIDIHDFDEELLATFPEDVAKQIKKYGCHDRGYASGGIRFTWWSNDKHFTRGFAFTLSEFYQENKIDKDNLISLEYCKKECKNTCDITGAYVSWDDGS